MGLDITLGDLELVGVTQGGAGGVKVWRLSTAQQHGITRAVAICVTIQQEQATSAVPSATVSYHWLALPGSVDSLSAAVVGAEFEQAGAHASSLDVRLVFRTSSMRSPHELLSAKLAFPPHAMDLGPPRVHPANSLPREQLSVFSLEQAGVGLSVEELQALCPTGVPCIQHTASTRWPYGVPSHCLPEIDVPLIDSVTRVCEEHCEGLELGDCHSVWFVGGNHAGRRGPTGAWLDAPNSAEGHNEWDDELMQQSGQGAAPLDKGGCTTGDAVQAWVLTPPGVTADSPPDTPLPVVMLVHGGPQGAWGDSWHYRWHPQSYAAAGFVVLAVNFHGSSGFGQAFQDAVTGDWGGAPQLDNMLGLRWLLHSSPWAGMVDPSRVAAAGASFGGYSVNWLNGHTRLLKAIVCHDGIFDSAAAAFTTEETWFMQWEFGGLPGQSGGAAQAAEEARRADGAPAAFPPLAPSAEVARLYSRWSPSSTCGEWRTPTLVIHGGRDYRLPETDGVAAFNALQRNGVPSRMLYFPEENHWVLGLANSLQWHKQVIQWLQRWTRVA